MLQRAFVAATKTMRLRADESARSAIFLRRPASR